MHNPALKNFEPYMLSKQAHGKTWYTLNIGKFKTTKQAQSVLKNLPKHLNEKPWLVKQ
jgi:septal ring-binding cell division protein DamX